MTILLFSLQAVAIEFKWHLALLVARLILNREESFIAWQTLTRWAKDKQESKIVRVNLIQGLNEILSQNADLMHDFDQTLSEIENENILLSMRESGNSKRGVTDPVENINKDIRVYNAAQAGEDSDICEILSAAISRNLPEAENKIWHAHPVWFLEGNPIVGYSKLKGCIRLMFWSGQSFDEEKLQNEGSFKAAEIRYTAVDQINKKDLARWLGKAREIQWDYKNIVKRKGVLERLK